MADSAGDSAATAAATAAAAAAAAAAMGNWQQQQQRDRQHWRDLVELTSNLEPLLTSARRGDVEDDVRRVLCVLSRRNRNNPLLVHQAHGGQWAASAAAVGTGAGAGSSQPLAVAEGLARRIAKGDVPSALRGARVVVLNLGTIASGARLRGEIEERVREVLEDVEDAMAEGVDDEGRRGTCILFLDKVHLVLGRDAPHHHGVRAAGSSNLLRSMLSSGLLRCIGATTLHELREWMPQWDAEFSRRFQTVHLKAPSPSEVAAILRAHKTSLEGKFGVAVDDAAVVAAVRLASLYVRGPGSSLLDKSLSVLESACEHASLSAAAAAAAGDGGRRDSRGKRGRSSGSSSSSSSSKREHGAVHLHEEMLAVEEELQGLQGNREELLLEIAEAAARMDLAHVADVTFTLLPQIDAAMRSLLQKQRRQQQLAAEAADDVDAEGFASAAAAQQTHPHVGAEEVREAVARLTGLPPATLQQNSRRRQLQQSGIWEAAVGQDEAVNAVLEAVARSKAGMGRKGAQPGATFLFVGPKGGGKGRLGDVLAARLAGSGREVVCVDLKDCNGEKEAVTLLDAALCVVSGGFHEGRSGLASGGAVGSRPRGVLVVEEVEKAPASVVANVIVPMLEHGFLHKDDGGVIDFGDAIVVLTTGAGNPDIFLRSSAPSYTHHLSQPTSSESAPAGSSKAGSSSSTTKAEAREHEAAAAAEGAKHPAAEAVEGASAAPSKSGDSSSGSTGGSSSRTKAEAAPASEAAVVEAAKQEAVEEATRHLRRELVDLVDATFVFSPLEQREMRVLARERMGEIAKRLAEGHGNVALAVSDDAIDVMLRDAGAAHAPQQTLRKVLEKKLVKQLARMLLSGEVSGNSTIIVDAAMPVVGTARGIGGEAEGILTFEVAENGRDRRGRDRRVIDIPVVFGGADVEMGG